MSTPPQPPALPTDDVTALLHAWGAGDDAAAGERLLRAIYAELHERAARAMRREGGDATLQATALVHEAYLRLADQRQADWRNRGQFYGVAARMMRRILVDHARARHAAKRGGDARPLTLGDADRAAGGDDGGVDGLDVLALHDALERLARLDPDQARLVELRYFAGLSVEETAHALGVSTSTAKREWATARAWLRRELAAP
jgi:RNA polymerase sigma factor (TIGR02999 family)